MDTALLQEKLTLIQRLSQTDDESVLMKVRALLFSDKETSEKSRIPDWFMSELLERKKSYENGETQTVSWEECKNTLLQKIKK